MAWIRYDFTDNGSSILPARYYMAPNQYLQSPNKRFKLIFQADGNLALYDGAQAVWVADQNTPFTNLSKGNKKDPMMVFMNYGFVLDDPLRGRIWSTTPSDPTMGSREDASLRAFTQVQDDGNIVTVDTIPHWYAPNGRPFTPGVGAAMIIGGATELVPGQFYSAGDHSLVFQGDGNLVVYGPNSSVVWATYTHNKGAVKCVMQADGNLVIYAANNVPVWQSGTGGHPGATIRLQANGSFAIVTERPVWARFGYTPTIKPPRVFYPDHKWKTGSYTWDNVF